MKHRILLVEDDLSISNMVKGYLSKEGFGIVCAFNGEEAYQIFLREKFDLILLDLMLPKLNGMDFLKMIRESSHLPILILSAKDGEVDKALGLGFGADDYITKPFSMIELAARVNAAIRRAKQYSIPEKLAEDRLITVNELTMDLENFIVSKNGLDIKVTSKEFAILKLLFTNPKRTFTKEQIYGLIWNEDYYGNENVINVHMKRLRDKIEDHPSEPKYIKTLWGFGYRLGEF
ncbi:response regulator transcription factor [Paenibacillus spongiae]|uniref:Response regulator transcription factor n=1 Tax=Paenibacillus spongiae TaxID=2909671 RepID=A0ABY5S5C3_9BACL|nr:response regulator transcription factor [Paenibacillus spongiae]UVI29101.1 response regulator transcription factor [Paenibacillus spongiae]